MADLLPSRPPASSSTPLAAEAYRAFFVARNGRVTGMVPVQATSLDEACFLARALVEGDEVVELWAGLRTVARFEHDGGSSPLS